MLGSSKQNSASLSAWAGIADAVRVLLVEDDEDYREIVGDELSEHGFAVRSFADGASLIASIGVAASADLLILDWALPDIPGIDLLPQLRQLGVNLPVVFLTGHSQVAREDQAFARGAVDFIDKTRGMEVLMRRLRIVADSGKRAVHAPTERRVVCGKLVLRPTVHRACWNEVDVGLTIGEYKIVYLLASNAGGHVTYRAIYDRLTYEGFIAGVGGNGYRANVRSAIKRIRNKFRACDPTFDRIENYTGFGYCWKEPV
jgi:two-component system, OmpR family, response regulator ChvI